VFRGLFRTGPEIDAKKRGIFRRGLLFKRGKHRKEVTEVTEGDWGVGTKVLWWAARPAGENYANRGKHRTEVTEATEGDGSAGEKGSPGHESLAAPNALRGSEARSEDASHRSCLTLPQGIG
jgi:hypothetical protein